MTTWIAEELFVAVYPDGRRVDGRIAIGRPHVVDSDDDEARCAVVVEPIRSQREAGGIGTLQEDAMKLAIGARVLASYRIRVDSSLKKMRRPPRELRSDDE